MTPTIPQEGFVRLKQVLQVVPFWENEMVERRTSWRVPATRPSWPFALSGAWRTSAS